MPLNEHKVIDLIDSQTATVRSSSPFEPDSSFNPDIDGRRLRVDDARSHFEPARVDARDVDFSDSIASKRKSYRTIRGKRRQKREDGVEVLGDISDEEDESLERKLARLRREAEELKEDIANRKAQREAEGAEEVETPDNTDSGILELSRALDKLHTSSRDAGSAALSPEEILLQRLSTGIIKDLKQADTQGSQAQAAESHSSAVLSHTASFDTRLKLLESALGLSNVPVPISTDDPSDTDVQPILPSLNHLSSQLSTLNSTLISDASNRSQLASNPSTSSAAAPPTITTTPHIEALSGRIRKLTTDAEALTAARQRALEVAKASFAARITASATSDDHAAFADPAVSSSGAIESDAATNEQAAKIQALYTTLPTITSLHPLLPSVLERLRSLRAIHAGAASASQDLSELEQHQADMKKEIDQWREGLNTMEQRVVESEAAMKSNMEVMGPWVKDLEKRLDTLEE